MFVLTKKYSLLLLVHFVEDFDMMNRIQINSKFDEKSCSESSEPHCTRILWIILINDIKSIKSNLNFTKY